MAFELIAGSYCGAAPVPETALGAWNFDPFLLFALTALLILMRRDARGVAAMAVLTLAFVSPLCALSVALFSARVVHHLLLVLVAAPLLAAALPGRAGRGSAAVWFLLSTAALWLWHVPAAYDFALRDMAVYWVMQVTLLGSAIGFWRAVLGQEPGFHALLWALAGLIQMGLLGALLTFAPQALYAAHAVAPLSWGLTPLGDQQLGGLIMWVPAMLPYLVIIGHLARKSWGRAGGAEIAGAETAGGEAG